MSYTLQDVDAAEALIRSQCPSMPLSRGDYDWTLCISNRDKSAAVILFQCGDDNRPEIKTDMEMIRDLCFLYGEQWTPLQIQTIKARAVAVRTNG